MYHRVVDEVGTRDEYRLCVSTKVFEAQMKYLRDHGYESISLGALGTSMAKYESPWTKPVVITFDDGYLDSYTIAFPILRKYGLTATVMLVSSRIGASNTWDQGSYMEGTPLLGLSEIREMARQGISFGSHSTTHRDMTKMDADVAWRELVDSKSVLEQCCGLDVSTFCFPYGRSTPELREMARQAGYVAACGIEQREHTLFNLSRVDPVRMGGSGLFWRLKVSGWHYRLPRNRVVKGMIGFVRRNGRDRGR